MVETYTTSLLRTGRVDDADLNLLEEDTHLVGSAFNELESALNGNLLFNPSESLRTIDWHRYGNLLPFYNLDDCTPDRKINVLYNALGSFLGIVDGLLTKEEIDQIKENDWKRQHFHYNRGDRVIVIDESFSGLLWSRLNQSLEGLPSHVAQPLGFGVSGTRWNIDGINPAIRINTYRKTEHFEAHRDAQFCASRRRRSVLSLIIYLSEPPGGETRFYASEAINDLPREPLGIDEEKEFYRSHSKECFQIDVQPVLGRCVLFTHDLMHESLPMTPGMETERIVLRTDVIASSDSEPYFMDREEIDDYHRALSLFIEAEQTELKAANFRVQNVKEYDPTDQINYPNNQFLKYQEEIRFLNKHCNHCYNKSLYLRYMYPRRLKHRFIDTRSDDEVWIRLGQTVVHIMEYLPVYEAVQLTVIYPFLKPSFVALEAKLNKDAAKFAEKARTVLKDLGKDNATNRYYLDFSIQSKYSFNEHVDAWCRVAAVLVAYRVSHASYSYEPVYCARFIPETGHVLAIPLDRLIYDAFFMRKSYGAIYAVRQEDIHNMDPQADFEACVERGVILRDHGLEFVGQNISEHFYVHIEPKASTVRRRLNCVDGMLGSSQSKHEVNLVSKSQGPGRHIFVQVDTEDQTMRYGVTHHADGNWRLTQNHESLHKTQHAMNQMIFDFKRYSFNVTRQASWEGIEYVVEVSEMINDIEPFYHAATYHHTSLRHETIYRGGGSMKLKYLCNTGTDSPFLDISGAPSELRVKPSKRGGDTWDVRVEWNGSFFPVTL